MKDDARPGEIALGTDPAKAVADAGIVFIGRVRTPWRERGDCPRNLREARERGGETSLLLDGPYRPGLDGLEPGRTVIVLYWLDRALEIDPNSVQATYARGVLHNLTGEADAATKDLAAAIQCSPLDPRTHSMRGHLGVASILKGDFDKALEWAEHAVRSPRTAHMSLFVASAAASLAGETVRAQHWKSELARLAPRITPALFFESMPLPEATQRQLTEAFGRIR